MRIIAIRLQYSTSAGMHCRAAIVAAAMLAGAAVACAQSPFEPVDELTPIAAVTAGLDTARVNSLVRRIRTGAIRDIHSLLIVRRGRLAVAEYFNGSGANDVHTMQSVSKSVTSALVGIAIGRGVFRGIDERVIDFYPPGQRAVYATDSRRAGQTIGDILTMRTGTDYDEGFAGSPHDQLNALRTGWDLFWLGRPMRFAPGTEWRYDSGGVIALSALFRFRTGSHADSFAAEHLFAPLGNTTWRWYRNDEGHPHLGGGLRLRAVDMASFGQLYLQGGRWGSRQVVPAAWVAASLREQVAFAAPRGRFTGYGYLWWRLPPASGATLPMHAAAGNLGQYIFLIPEFETVVTVTAGAQGADMRAPVEFLYSDIVPALNRPR